MLLMVTFMRSFNVARGSIHGEYHERFRASDTPVKLIFHYCLMYLLAQEILLQCNKAHLLFSHAEKVYKMERIDTENLYEDRQRC